MPIYAYRCASCGHAKDVLQKLSDDALTVCPACGAATFSKQLTAAGFQLKGSGWYVTDFREGDKGKKDAKKDGAPEGDGKAADAKPVEKAAEAAGKTGDGAASAATPTAAPVNAPAPAPAAAATPASPSSNS
jgi:putative FmdB family regulatory protein